MVKRATSNAANLTSVRQSIFSPVQTAVRQFVNQTVGAEMKQLKKPRILRKVW